MSNVSFDILLQHPPVRNAFQSIFRIWMVNQVSQNLMGCRSYVLAYIFQNSFFLLEPLQRTRHGVSVRMKRPYGGADCATNCVCEKTGVFYPIKPESDRAKCSFDGSTHRTFLSTTCYENVLHFFQCSKEQSIELHCGLGKIAGFH